MLIGIDAGGTSTRAVVVDASGHCRGYGRAGGGNPVSWGPERAAAEVARAVVAAVRQARSGAGGDDSGAGAGANGYDDVPGERSPHTATLALAGGATVASPGPLAAALAQAGVPCRLTVESDLLATFCAGTHRSDGYALVAGTGTAAARVAHGRIDSAADGLGWLLGDAGSGFWIGHRVVRSALGALDGRCPATALTPLLLAELGVGGADPGTVAGRSAVLHSAVAMLYRQRPVELARFAALAFRAAAGKYDAGQGAGGLGTGRQDEGPDGSGLGGSGLGGGIADPVAAQLLADARTLLVRAVVAVRQDETRGPVVLGGGIAVRLPGLAEALKRALADESFPEPAVRIVADGTVGAAVLALRHTGIAVDEQLFHRLKKSFSRLAEGSVD